MLQFVQKGKENIFFHFDDQILNISSFASLAAVPELWQLGNQFSSSKPVRLTESKAEYTVTAIKHMFTGYVVLQFDCTNTLPDQILGNVQVDLKVADGGWVLAQLLTGCSTMSPAQSTGSSLSLTTSPSASPA